jgi:predicted patatin/cPLA2 family phospholipase
MASRSDADTRIPPLPADVHPVVDVLRERQQTGSRPGARDDGHRVALAIEGGSMRSVVSAGMASALDYLGLRDAFDDVYGSSAGTLIGAYFIAGQASIAPSIYFQDLTTKEFAHTWRLLVRRPIMDLDFLFRVIDERKPLDWEALLASPIRFHPLATSLTTGEIVDFADLGSREALRDALRAGSVLPVIAGEPFVIDGHSYLDAGLRESFPYGRALADGATHVLVLRTRPPGKAPSGVSARQRVIAERFLRTEPRILDLVDARPERYVEEDRQLARLVADEAATTPVFAINPTAGGANLDRLSSNRELIEAAARGGMRAAFAALGLEAPVVFEVLRPYATVAARVP